MTMKEILEMILRSLIVAALPDLDFDESLEIIQKNYNLVMLGRRHITSYSAEMVSCMEIYSRFKKYLEK
jgi:hypothetical protein